MLDVGVVVAVGTAVAVAAVAAAIAAVEEYKVVEDYKAVEDYEGSRMVSRRRGKTQILQRLSGDGSGGSRSRSGWRRS